MNKKEREQFHRIVNQLEQRYKNLLRDSNNKDSVLSRAVFYDACLKMTQEGPELESQVVQNELAVYYTKMRDIERDKAKVRRRRAYPRDPDDY